MKAAILGAGPSGMMAAWACIQYGYDVSIYDQRSFDELSVGDNHGVFACWDNCDLYLSQKSVVRVGVIGAKGLNIEEMERRYALKVYGDEKVETSIGKYMEVDYRECYNHAEIYQQILDIVGRRKFIQQRFDGLRWPEECDLVICTLPAYLVAREADWPSETAYIIHSKAPAEDAFMIYNINEYVDWYRCSAIFGFFSQEFSFRPETDKRVVKVTKVLPPPIHPRELFPSLNIIFTGRYGAWNKEMLTEDVYYNVLRQLSDRKRNAGRAVSASI